jgi:short subunit dehydrogenase-like uncharacterized protein
MAVDQGLRPILAGRDALKINALAGELSLDSRVFNLDDSQALDQALIDVGVVLHCAGPYLYTSKPMAEACLRGHVHYLDITGEIPVYSDLADLDAEAKAQGVMLLPGTGFDVVPTDCLAAHLHRRLPSATHLALAFCGEGPGGIPPGTAKTLIEMMPFGEYARINGQLVKTSLPREPREIDFGSGPRQAARLSWGDGFMAFVSTGIPNIEDYSVLPPVQVRMMAFAARVRLLFKLRAVREILKKQFPSGSTTEQRLQSRTHVWGEARDDQGRVVVSRMHGPEAGVVWTGQAALAAARKVLAGAAVPGFQTPSKAFGADFVLENDEVSREDVV